MTVSPDFRFLSLGLGTQSCCLALKSAAGEMPKLDGVIFADTQGELPETYAYLEYLRSVLEPAGIPIYVVTAGNLEQALLGQAGHLSVNPAPPAHIQKPNGEKGRLGGYKCSYDYKRLQIQRKIKQLVGPRGAWKRLTVEQWIGFSQDEYGRVKENENCRCGHKRVARTRSGEVELRHTADGCIQCDCPKFDPWLVNRWPLIEMRMKRDDTIRWFEANGHPTPPRSACWFCPNSGNVRWQFLKAEHPDLFERACQIDEAIRDVKDFKWPDRDRGIEGQKFLHASLVPLRDADIRTDRQVLADAGHLSLFDDVTLAMDCQAEVCIT